jgi:hypothetical protein
MSRTGGQIFFWSPINFHRALLRTSPPAFIRERKDLWAVGDRVAWGEEQIDWPAVLEPLAREFQALMREPIVQPPQVIHGDLGGNVLFAEGVTPAVIDFSPYFAQPHSPRPSLPLTRSPGARLLARYSGTSSTKKISSGFSRERQSIAWQRPWSRLRTAMRGSIANGLRMKWFSVPSLNSLNDHDGLK